MTNRFVTTLRAEPLDDRCVPTAIGRYAVGAGPGGPPRVQVYDVSTGIKLADFLAYEDTFSGGVTTAMGDVNHDGVPDLVVGAGNGGGPRVRVFNGAAFGPGFDPNRAGSIIADFFAFEDSQRGGVNVTTGIFVNAVFDEVVVGAGPGGGPRVRVLSGAAITGQGQLFTSVGFGDVVADFFAFESTFRGGVTVAANPTFLATTSFSDLAVAPGAGGAPRVRVLSGLSIFGQQLAYTSFSPGDEIADFFSGDPNTRAGLFVAAAELNGDGQAEVITGTGPGLPALVTVFDGTQIRGQRTAFTGNLPGDRVDQFTPLANYDNGVSVGATASLGVGTAGLLHGTGGAGLASDFVLSQYTTVSGQSTRQVVFEQTFDPALLTGVNVSN